MNRCPHRPPLQHRLPTPIPDAFQPSSFVILQKDRGKGRAAQQQQPRAPGCHPTAPGASGSGVTTAAPGQAGPIFVPSYREVPDYDANIAATEAHDEKVRAAEALLPNLPRLLPGYSPGLTSLSSISLDPAVDPTATAYIIYQDLVQDPASRGPAVQQYDMDEEDEKVLADINKPHKVWGSGHGALPHHGSPSSGVNVASLVLAQGFTSKGLAVSPL